MPENILFTGESDFSALINGIDGMTAGLRRAQDGQDSLSKSIESTQAILTSTNTGIKNLTAQIAALDKNSKDYAATSAQLNSRLTALNQQQTKYTSILSTQQKQFTDTKVTIDKMIAAYDAATKSVKNLQTESGKPIAPTINDGKITAAIGNIRGKVAGMGNEIARTLTDTTTPAVSKFSSLVENLGGLWGPLGIAAGVGLGFVVKKIYDIVTALTEAEKRQKLYNSVFEEAGKIGAAEVSRLEVLKFKINDVNTSVEDRTKLIHEYNQTADTANQISDKEIGNLDLINQRIQTQIELTGRRAIAKAAENNLQAEADKLIVAQEKFMKQTNTTSIGAATAVATSLQRTVESSEKANQKLNQSSDALVNKTAAGLTVRNNKLKAANNEYLQAQKEFHDKLEFLANLIAGVKIKAGVPPPPPPGGTSDIANIYEQELQKLKSDIAKINEKGFTDESTITKAVEEDFKKRDLALKKAFEKHQLTADELAKLRGSNPNVIGGYLGQLMSATLSQSLNEFADKKKDFLTKIGNEISAVQLQTATQDVQFIQDDFERQRQIIELESKKTIEAAKRSRDAKLAEVAKSTILKPDEIKQRQDEINRTYSDWFDSLEELKNQKLQKLSFDTFNKLGDNLQRTFNVKDLHISENQLLDIQAQNKLLAEGKINYKQYQEAITGIAKQAADDRFEIEKEKLTKEIQALENRLVLDAVQDKDNKDKLTQDQVKQLQDKIIQLKKQLAAAQNQNNTQPKTDNTGVDNGLENLAKYVKVMNDVVQQVGSFWQQVNDLEAKSLDRSIAIQDRRVEAARNVAARGNAEYLRLEEEKQQQLLLKQENAARRQMAINAALQASQLLVAITGAIASAVAATGPGAPFVIAGDIAAIVGALAAGYVLVKSLNQNQPSFFVGTEDTGHGGKADEKGGFHAMLHPHERVLTAEENKQLKGISNKQLIETVQQHRVFVEQWKTKPAPQLNIAAMEMATNHSTRAEAIRMEGLERRIDETNVLQKAIVRSIKGIGISFNWNERGASLSILKTLDEIDKGKKS